MFLKSPVLPEQIRMITALTEMTEFVHQNLLFYLIDQLVINLFLTWGSQPTGASKTLRQPIRTEH